MRRRLIYIIAVGLLTVCAWLFWARPHAHSEATGESVLRHVVMFKFKDSATPEQIDEIAVAFAALPSEIDAIKGFEWGTDVSEEGKSKGFTHLFLVTFENEEGLKTYLPHPDHQAFVALLKPQLDDVMVIDYFSRR